MLHHKQFNLSIHYKQFNPKNSVSFSVFLFSSSFILFLSKQYIHGLNILLFLLTCCLFIFFGGDSTLVLIYGALRTIGNENKFKCVILGYTSKIFIMWFFARGLRESQSYSPAPPTPVLTCWPSWCLGGEVPRGNFNSLALSFFACEVGVDIVGC